MQRQKLLHWFLASRFHCLLFKWVRQQDDHVLKTMSMQARFSLHVWPLISCAITSYHMIWCEWTQDDVLKTTSMQPRFLHSMLGPWCQVLYKLPSHGRVNGQHRCISGLYCMPDLHVFPEHPWANNNREHACQKQVSPLCTHSLNHVILMQYMS